MLGLQQSAFVYGRRADAPSTAKRRSPTDPMTLWRACSQGDMLLARSLLKADPGLADSLDRPHPSKGSTALMAAAKHRAGAEIVRLLLELGADAGADAATATTRDTALHYAAQSSDVLSTELLIAAGADVYALNADGLMPLDIARRRGRSEVARALMTRMQVHAGWLSVRSSESTAWKRAWAVVVSTSADGASSELCLFRSPTHARPHAVVLVDPATRATLDDACASPSKSRRPAPEDQLLAFQLDRPAIYQELHLQRFSRDRRSGRTLSRGNVQIRDLVLAADSAKERGAWIAALTKRDDDEEEEDEEGGSAWSSLSCRASSGSLRSPDAVGGHEGGGDRCVICASAPRNAVCSPCGHLAACYPCLRAATLKTRNKCPICRGRVHAIVRVYTA